MPNRIHVPDLIGGVSQLPTEQRGANQLETLDNGMATVSRGLRKRPPTEAVGTISTSTAGFDSAYVHAVNRTETERYTIIIVNGDLKVFDTITGIEQTVLFPNGKGYLTGGLRGFRAFTVGDHTFVVNRDRLVRRGTARSAAVPHEALLFFRMADYATGYIIRIDNFAFAFTTPLDSTAHARVEIATDAVAQGMLTVMVTHQQASQFFAQFTVVQYGSTLYIKRIDGGDFVITTTDGLSDKGLKLIKGKVQSMEDLPEKAKEGFLVEIIGNPGSPKDNTFVRYESTTEGLSDGESIGVWRECPAPSIVIEFDDATMPHELVRQGYLQTNNILAPPRQPIHSVQAAATGAVYYGYNTDGADVSIGSQDDGHFVDVGGNAVRSIALTTGTHATLPRRVTFRYSVDASSYRGTRVHVELWKNTGAGWVYDSRVPYPAGTFHRDQQIFLLGVFPTGTRFELRLISDPALSSFRRARLSVPGRNHTNRQGDTPAIVIEQIPSALLTLGPPTAHMPSGTVLAATIDSVSFSYTLTTDMLTSAIGLAFAVLIDAHASFTAVYVAPTTNQGARVSVARVDGATPSFSAASTAFSNTTRGWGNVGMTPGEHVGRIVRNITDGSEGIITANSVRAFTVASLIGGRTNRFNRSDSFAILDTASAYFVFQQAPWTDRLVGNDAMSKWPGFVDRRISEVFFTANRLGFTAEDFVSLSGSGDLYRFWRGTVTQVLDADPIDVQSAHKDVGFLDSAVSWEGRTLLCSSSGHQFALTGEPVLSPTTVRLDHVSSYPMSAKSRPMVSGGSVFFGRKSGGFAQLRELYRTRDGVDSALVTAAVPRYIPGDVLDISGDPDHGFVAVLPDGGSRNAVFVYTYAPVGDGKATAWQRWTFPDRVIGIDVAGGYLYLVLYRGEEVRLERINFGNPMADSGNHRDIGSVSYTLTATLSRLHMRDRDGDTLSSGRAQVRTVAPQVSSGYVRTQVAVPGRPTKEYVWSTRQKRHPVLAENTAATVALVNDQNTGCTITGLEYEVTYSNRSS